MWGSLRPNVLLWLIDEKGLNRNIISNSSSSSLPQAINAFSNERGLPIMMPLMDFTDANQIKTSDIWGRFQQPIEEASSRYLAEAIVVIRISDSSLVESLLYMANSYMLPFVSGSGFGFKTMFLYFLLCKFISFIRGK